MEDNKMVQNRKMGKKMLMIFGTAVFVIIIVAVAAMLFLGAKNPYSQKTEERLEDGPPVLYYVKDGVTYILYDTDKKRELNDEFLFARLNADSRYMFYLIEETHTLKVVELASSNEPTVIAKNVIGFDVSQKGNIVYYLKNVSEGKRILCKWEGGTEKEITENPSDFEISRDGRKAYIEIDNIWYKYDGKKVKRVTPEDCDKVLVHTDTWMYYINKEGYICYYDNKPHVIDFIKYSQNAWGSRKTPVILFFWQRRQLLYCKERQIDVCKRTQQRSIYEHEREWN